VRCPGGHSLQRQGTDRWIVWAGRPGAGPESVPSSESAARFGGRRPAPSHLINARGHSAAGMPSRRQAKGSFRQKVVRMSETLTEVLASSRAVRALLEDDVGEALRRLGRTSHRGGQDAADELQAEALRSRSSRTARTTPPATAAPTMALAAVPECRRPVDARSIARGHHAGDARLWQKRATEAKHPLLRARYADLAWDFARRVTARGRIPNGPHRDRRHVWRS